MGLSPPRDIRRRTNTTATGRGKDANELEESRPRTGSGSSGPGREPAGASAGAADRALPDCIRSRDSGFRATRKTRSTKFTSISISVITRRAGGSSRRAGVARAPRRPTGRNRSRRFRCRPARRGDRWSDAEDEEGLPAARRDQASDAAASGCDRSPFEDPIEDKPATPARIRAGPEPSPTPPGDPFELDKPRSRRRRTGPAAAAGARAASNGPELSAPADQPGRSGSPHEPKRIVRRARLTAMTTSPVLALPSVNLPPVDDPGVPFGTQPPAPAQRRGERECDSTAGPRRPAAVS